MAGVSDAVDAELARRKRRLDRERKTRSESEAIAENAIRELYEKQRQLELLRAIAVAVNEPRTVEEVMQFAVDRVCAHTGWPVGHVYVIAADGTRDLVPTRIWHLADPGRFEAFRRVTEATRFRPGIGLPGRVLAAGKAAWITDVTKDANFPRARVATVLNVRAAFGFPVLVGSEVVAVLEFFAGDAMEPDAAWLEVMTDIGTQMGRVIERKQAGEALTASERRFRALIENSSDGVTLTAQDRTILYVSPAMTRIMGYAGSEMVGRNTAEFWHPDDVGIAGDWLARVAQAPGQVPTMEARFRHKDGSWPWLEVVGTNMLTEPSVRAIVINYRDITERRALEEQLRQAQKMEAIGQLAGGVAHDFNNLLTVITGRSELLQRRLPSGDPLRRHVDLIHATGLRGGRLTVQLLAFSRKQVLQPKVLDLAEVVAQIEPMLRRLIGEDIDLLTTRRDPVGRVRTDPGQLEQVMLNLVVNARDAMPRGGRLSVEIANAELDEAYTRRHQGVRPGRYVMLAVSDSGTGMSEETRARIFEPFFTTKAPEKGTGLGLSTVYGIVKQGGGNIWVYSELGRGTTFKIYLPRVDEAPEPEKAAPTIVLSARGSETILLVEDEASLRDLAREILEAHGYSVLEARHGGDALLVAERHPGAIQLLLTDVVMPEMSGRDLARRLAVTHPETAVLYMSGYPGSATEHHGVLEPGLSFIQKPFTTTALTRKVREVLDRRHPASPQAGGGTPPDPGA